MGETEDPLCACLTRPLSLAGMSHEPKSPSLGMLSTATRTTATVSPLTPSPLNGSIVPNGSPAASSTLSVQAAPSSSFAAALRKLAKQAEEPRGGDRDRDSDKRCCLSQELVFSCHFLANAFSWRPVSSLGIQFIRSDPSAVSLTVPWESTAWHGPALLPPTTLLFPEVPPNLLLPQPNFPTKQPQEVPSSCHPHPPSHPFSPFGCQLLLEHPQVPSATWIISHGNHWGSHTQMERQPVARLGSVSGASWYHQFGIK